MKLKRLHFLLLFIFAAGHFWGADLPDRHPLDQSESRTLVLENGLRVILVSDPTLNISAASMAVDVGSYSDPDDAAGLAHFLEHMLFLGTAKYPDEGEYKEYLSQNGGYSNAYTVGDHTNYHFEVFPNAFEGALDRFSQFFIAPLFTPEFTEREMNAVQSEHSKNLEDDGWRRYMLFRSLTDPDHPENHFGTGDLETLKNVSQEQLIDFYRRYYSANQMALSLVSTQNLDQLEEWARDYLADVTNHGREELRYPETFFSDKSAVRIVKMKAIGDQRQLNIYFNTPGKRDDWDAKSAEIIGSLIGYEGKGSFLSRLKEENLATQLGAGLYEGTVDYTIMSISINLTPTGKDHFEKVLEMLMGYIEMLRQSPYPEHFYREQATMARLSDVYSDKGEGASRATSLANRALIYPLEEAENVPTAYLRQDPDFYYRILDRLRPENMLAILSAQDVETDRSEKIYGTDYAYNERRDGLFDRLVSPPVTKQFALPNKNPFVPEAVTLLPERPVQLIDEPGLSLYYGMDHEFQRPRVAMSFKFRRSDRAYDAQEAAALELYTAAANEFVNEIAYDARLADLGYSISGDLEGMQVSLFGYTDSARKLLPVLTDALTEFEISEERFDSIKDRLVRGWRNARFNNGFMYIRYYTNKATYRDYFTPEELADAAGGVTLKDVYALRDRLYQEGKIESLIYGNMNPDEAVRTVRGLQERIGLKAPGKDLYENQLVEMTAGESHVFKDTLPTNNHVFRKDYTIGLATPGNRVTAAVLQNLINAPYYSEMRTRQQLGYVVWSFTFNRDDEVKLGFVIQSGEYDPLELVSRSDELVSELPDMLRAMPPEAFAQAKEAVRLELEVKPKTIAEKAGRFFALAYDHGANWSRVEESLAVLETLSREDIIALMESVNDPDQHRYQLVLLFARQQAELAAQTEALEDMNAWKTQQAFRRITRI